MRYSQVVAVVAAGLAGATAADAQQLHAGAKVRLEAPAAGMPYREGILLAGGDTLVIRAGADTLRVEQRSVTLLEVSRGSSRLTGAWAGARWGAAASIFFSVVTGESLAIAAHSLVVGTLWWSGAGALIGAERWERLPLPVATRTSMRVRPWVAREGRVGVMATLR